MSCGCASGGETTVRGGFGVTVTGVGTQMDPYIVTSSSSDASLGFADTNTVDLTRTGSGTSADPYIVSGDVRLDPQGAIVVGSGGVGVALDGGAGNILTITSAGRLRASGSAAVGLADDGGLEDTDTGLAIKVDPASPAPITLTAAGLSVNPNLDAVTTRMNLLQTMQRQQQYMIGGGDKQANQSYVRWSAGFYVGAPRRSGEGSNGIYQIDNPPNGTVITGLAGASNATVPSSGNYAGMVPLGDWQSLWYLVPIGNNVQTSVAANFRIVGTGAVATMPDNAVLIASRSGLADKTVIWGDTSKTVPWLYSSNTLKYGAALNMSGMSQRLSYRIIDGMAEVDYFGVWTAGQNVSGLMYIDLPITAPAHDITLRNYHNVVGTGRFVSAAAAPKAAWEFMVQPLLVNNTSRVYFLVPRAASDASVGGLFPNSTFNQSVPRIDEGPILATSSELYFKLTFPYVTAPN